MNIEDLPNIKHLNDQVESLKKLLLFSGLLVGSKEYKRLKKELESIKKQAKEYQNYAEKFNKYFSNDGWIVHNSLNFNTLKTVVDSYEKGNKGEALKLLLNHYSPTEIEKRIYTLKHVEELQIRYKFIKYALSDYKEKKYYSAVPLLLMVIDGAVNDAIRKGFHSNNVDLNVWDALTAADNGIQTIKTIFQKGRRKTVTEDIDMPYRNGILHGMDLGYDNKVVAVKSWHFLFVINDWISSKKSESKRKQDFEEETRTPTIKEIMDQLKSTKEDRDVLDNWEARKTDPEYITRLNRKKGANNKELPELVVLQLLKLWKQSNYGDMAKLFSVFNTKNNFSKYASEVRSLYGDLQISKFTILEIIDTAPAITEVLVQINISDKQTEKYRFRLMYEDEDGNPLVRNHNGKWRIMLINPLD